LKKKGEEIYQEIYEDEDDEIHKLFQRPLKSGLSEITICRDELPGEGEIASFEIYTVNHSQKKIVGGYIQDYKGEMIQGFVSRVKPSLVSQYLYLQIIKPHSINSDLVKIEFVGVNTTGAFRLKKLRSS
jgi:hypothetical protein